MRTARSGWCRTICSAETHNQMADRNDENEPTRYDAILIASFSGPEGTADVMPFLNDALRGKNVPCLACAGGRHLPGEDRVRLGFS